MERDTKEKCVRILQDMEKFQTINKSDISPLVATILPRLLNEKVDKVPPTPETQNKLRDHILELFEDMNEAVGNLQAFLNGLDSYKETHLEWELLEDLSKKIYSTEATLIHLTRGLEDDEIESLIESSIL